MFRNLLLSIMFASVAYAQQMQGGPAPNQNPNGPGGGQNRGGRVVEQIPDFATVKPVPHGQLSLVWYDSKTLGEQRRLHIWTPPGYDASKATKYPVLYLIHGGGQNDSAWHEAQAEYIMDNLMAEGKIKPMILVMPNGAVGKASNPGGFSNGADGMSARQNAARQDVHTFLSDMTTGIIPYVDSHYHTLTDRNDRAIAGFSYGGAQTIWAATTELDKFAWFGTFSMGIEGGSTAGAGSIAGSGNDYTPEEFVKANESFFADAKKTNAQVKLFFIGAGKDDTTVGSGPKQLADTLTAHDIHNDYRVYEGAHNMTTWRACLRDFSQLLFH